MKGTDNFKRVIENYLSDKAKSDILFAEQFAKEGKSIEDCIAYIINKVKSSGVNGFEDQEEYDMAIEYYAAGDLEKQVMPNVQVVTNHHEELTEKELADIREKAINEAIAAKKKQITAKTIAKKPVSDNAQISLF